MPKRVFKEVQSICRMFLSTEHGDSFFLKKKAPIAWKALCLPKNFNLVDEVSKIFLVGIRLLLLSISRLFQ